jgi:RNase adaptor protein for sRNA GlmZ degradation
LISVKNQVATNTIAIGCTGGQSRSRHTCCRYATAIVGNDRFKPLSAVQAGFVWI